MYNRNKILVPQNGLSMAISHQTWLSFYSHSKIANVGEKKEEKRRKKKKKQGKVFIFLTVFQYKVKRE